MMRLDEIESTAELARELGLDVQRCPRGRHLDSEDACGRDRTCQMSACHDTRHSYRLYSAGSEHGSYVPFGLQKLYTRLALANYQSDNILSGEDADGKVMVCDGWRWSGKRYALDAPPATALITLHIYPSDWRYLGLCRDCLRERRDQAVREWEDECQRIMRGELSAVERLVLEAGDVTTLDMTQAEDMRWLLEEGRQYGSLLDAAEARGWLHMSYL